MMGAGLESDVERAVWYLRLILGRHRCETIHLRMSLSAPLMIPLTDDPILPDQHRTDPRIGADSLQLSTAGKVDGSPHVSLVVTCHCLWKMLVSLLQMDIQSHSRHIADRLASYYTDRREAIGLSRRLLGSDGEGLP